MLFLGNGFDEVVRSREINFAAVQALKKGYGNTMTTTLWRVVELALDVSWGLVSKHPRSASGPLQEDIRYYIRSRRFAAEFGRVGLPTIFGEIQKRCYGRKGPIGHGQFLLTNDRGEQHEFRFETFFNGYDALTFGTWLAARPVAVAMRAS